MFSISILTFFSVRVLDSMIFQVYTQPDSVVLIQQLLGNYNCESYTICRQSTNKECDKYY